VLESKLIFKSFTEKAEENAETVGVLLWQKHKNRSLFEENSYIDIIGWANALLLMYFNHWQIIVRDKKVEIIILLFVRNDFFLCNHIIELKNFGQFQTFIETQILDNLPTI
jgi:hypothetical protein